MHTTVANKKCMARKRLFLLHTYDVPVQYSTVLYSSIGGGEASPHIKSTYLTAVFTHLIIWIWDSILHSLVVWKFYYQILNISSKLLVESTTSMLLLSLILHTLEFQYICWRIRFRIQPLICTEKLDLKGSRNP